MNKIIPYSDATPWALLEEAQKLPNSAGKTTLRVDLLKLSGKKNIFNDVKKHFQIALAGNRIIIKKSHAYKKKGFLRNQVAVKISDNEPAENKYIIMNINSLSKRLGVNKKDIRYAEKEGKVMDLIKKRLDQLQRGQNTVNGIIQDVEGGYRYFLPKLIKDEEKGEYIIPNIKSYCNKKLKKELNKYIENPKDFSDEQRTALANKLRSLQWWKSDMEIASNLVSRKDIGGTITRKTKEGEKLLLHYSKDWDGNGNYTFAVSEFAYEKKELLPSKRGWVPLNIGQLSETKTEKDLYVLANVKSLKSCFGFTDKQIKQKVNEGKVHKEVSKKLNDLEADQILTADE